MRRCLENGLCFLAQHLRPCCASKVHVPLQHDLDRCTQDAEEYAPVASQRWRYKAYLSYLQQLATTFKSVIGFQ